MYVALFLATLAPAVFICIRRGGDSAVVAIVLLTSFLGAHAAWASGYPVYNHAVMDLICALAILLICNSRWTNGVALLFLLAVMTSVIAELRAISGYAHVLSVLGHAQNIALMIGGAENGRHYRKGRRVDAYN